MPDPTQIWGTYGESSGGAGTGGPTPETPDPDGAYADCTPVVPDVPATDDRTLWAAVKSCGGTTVSTEWVPIDDPTYPVGWVGRVSDLNGGDLSGEQCVYVSDDYSLSDGVPDTLFPQHDVICGGYPSCTECNATCYKITDCLSAGNTYSNNTAYAGVTGFQSVVDGRCKTVAVESDKSNCCPDTDTDSVPAGTYANCASCDDAISPTPAPCECPYGGGDDGPSTVTATISAKLYSCDGSSWSLDCSGSGSVTMTQTSAGACSWENSSDTISCGGGGATFSNFYLYLDTDACEWYLTFDSSTSASSTSVRKTLGQTPMGSYEPWDAGFGLGCAACDPPDSGDCYLGGPVSAATVVSASVG